MQESVKRRDQPMERTTALDSHQSTSGPCRHAAMPFGAVVWILYVVHECSPVFGDVTTTPCSKR
jgi:hypothetical protein